MSRRTRVLLSLPLSILLIQTRSPLAGVPENPRFTESSLGVASGDPMRPIEWQRGLFGSRIGVTGLWIGDLDLDGSPEIVSTGSSSGAGNDFFQVLKPTASGVFVQSWISPLYATSHRYIRKIA